MEPPICPYCGNISKLASSKEVYNGRDYGPIYLCRPCDAYVGCHKGSIVPLGRLADRELRMAKKAAHAAFDPLWKRGKMSRGAAYRWLAKKLNIPSQECHIGMFDINTCQKVIDICVARDFA